MRRWWRVANWGEWGRGEWGPVRVKGWGDRGQGENGGREAEGLGDNEEQKYKSQHYG